jgi:hypothetical protein
MQNWELITVVIVIWSLTGCDPRYGFMESRFRLADESRLPKWFNAMENYARKDLKVIITFYTHPIFESKVRICLYGPPQEERKLDEKIGTRIWHRTTLRESDKGSLPVYPSYVTITVDDAEEVFEHRSKGDILYIVDKPHQ